MLKIRRSRDHLIFNMGIPILVRRHLYIETDPRWSEIKSQHNKFFIQSELWVRTHHPNGCLSPNMVRPWCFIIISNIYGPHRISDLDWGQYLICWWPGTASHQNMTDMLMNKKGTEISLFLFFIIEKIKHWQKTKKQCRSKFMWLIMMIHILPQ